LKESETSLFDFYSEININNDNLWTLFGVLAFTLPEQVSFIINEADEEPVFSPYSNRQELIETLTKYSKELSQDGLIEFGVVYQDEDSLIEVFVKKSKYIQYWGSDYQSFLSIMSEFKLSQIDNLNFIDEFPLVTTPSEANH
jgi:hypothetical protein